MNKQNFDVNKLRVASPCSVGWETMSSDERIRRCSSCELNVYNISKMTKTEVEDLIGNREGRVCIRLYKRADGTVLTKDCPVGFRVYQKRVARFAGATLATILGLFSVSFGQKEDKKPVDAPKVKIVRTSNQNHKNNLSGVILDFQGAVIPGTEIKLYQKDLKNNFKVTSDAEGNYIFENVPAGKYDLEVNTPGFQSYRMNDLEINGGESLSININLQQAAAEVVGIYLEEPLIDPTSSGVTTTITRKMIERIPH